mgnify:CR=1 FL=1
MAKKRSLGKGLGALIPQDFHYDEKEDNKEKHKIEYIEISKIKAREDQPRKEFDQNRLQNLADSIDYYGVIEPIILTEKEDGMYEIIAGERRYRASILAGKEIIPAIVKDVEGLDVEILSLIENIQREDLNPYEEAMAYRKFSEDYGMTQGEISKKVGKSRSYIANSQRLLNLDDLTMEELKKGNLTSTQARTLLSIEDFNERSKYRDLLIKKEINIKDIENIFKSKRNNRKKPRVKASKDIYIEEIESRFRETLGTKVTIDKKGGVWNANIELYSEDDIENLLRRLENAE